MVIVRMYVYTHYTRYREKRSSNGFVDIFSVCWCK